MSLVPRALRRITDQNRLDPGVDLIDGLALGGVDPTSYVIDGGPRPGDARWEADWNGARWRFVSADRRDTFLTEPERWAPQFGGHCAVGRATGVWVDGDPRRWHLDGDRLYLNKNRAAHHLHPLLRRRISRIADDLARERVVLRVR